MNIGVYGIGLPRSGTTSLKSALKTLGYIPGKTCFVGDQMCLPLDKFKTLDRTHPDAKFIFTHRKSAETWLSSVNKRTPIIEKNPAILRQRKAMYGSEKVIPEIYLPIYYQREVEVRNYFLQEYPEDVNEKLLCMCFEKGHGWQELCSFLNKLVPKESFPHKNRSK